MMEAGILVGIILFIALVFFIVRWAVAQMVESVRVPLVTKLGQQTLNVLAFAVCCGISYFGAIRDAWEDSYESMSSWIGLTPPTNRFNSIAFADEYLCEWTLEKTPMPYKVGS